MLTFRNGLVASLLILSACAHDSYTGGDPQKYATDLSDCKRTAMHNYLQDRSNGGAVVGGVLGGAVGGALGALVDDAAGPNQIQPGDIKPMVESCMASHGYIANADNRP